MSLRTLLICLPLSACARPGEAPPPPAPAAPVQAEAPTDPLVPGFGPAGAVLVHDDEGRALEVGMLRVPLRDAGGGSPCDEGGTDAPPSLIDTDGDGRVELFVAHTFSTGAGVHGAVDQLAVCAWRWPVGEVAPVLLSALSEELTSLGVGETADITAYLTARRIAPEGWAPLTVEELPPPADRSRAFQVGSHQLQIQQTGTYTAAVKVIQAGRSGQATDLFALDPAAVGAASRPWDYEGQWEAIEGACCALDVSRDRDDSPRITGAWRHGAISYVVIRQEQSAHAPACQVVRVAAVGAGPHDEGCAAFEQARAAGGP